MTHRQLAQEIQDAFDGELDDARADALRETLHNTPGALDLYCDQALLESELHRHAAGRRKVPGTLSARTNLDTHIRRRRQAFISLATAAAFVLIAGITLRFFLTPPHKPLASIESSPGTILLQTDGTPFTATSLNPGTSLTLQQGVIKLTLANRVDTIIEGPATFSIPSPNTFRIHSGHSWFHVPPAAQGFRVVTNDIEVIDLGTEFGIDLREDIPPQVHCLKGKIEARSKIGNKQSLTLTAGQAATLNPIGHWISTPASSNKFRTTLPASLPRLRLTFDRLNGENLHIDGNIIGLHSARAFLRFPENANLVPGIRGRALEFDGRSNFVETTWPGISGTAARTLSLWCRIPPNSIPNSAPPLAVWGNPEGSSNRKFKAALVSNKEGHTNLRLSFGQMLINGTTALNDDQWHHLAIVYRGNDSQGNPDFSLYIDGAKELTSTRLMSEAPIATDTTSPLSLNLSIGRYELPTSANPYLRATLDEFQIIAGALDDAEILRLANEY